MPNGWNWTRLALMAVGTFDVLAFGALFLSDDAMAAAHQALGLRELPRSPIVGYLARTASLQYGLHGLLLWAASRNVARFSPLVPWIAGLKLLQALAIGVVDATGGMPLWWTIVEPSCLALAGLGLLAAWFVDRRREAGIGD
ncbi:MAG TPA: hypothetical protein VGN57_08815 [Pirellulaceae bacterium]|jgi:hypothetical protein|nr:hypothetical protein [Pirellulaceae bacterium]